VASGLPCRYAPVFIWPPKPLENILAMIETVQKS